VVVVGIIGADGKINFQMSALSIPPNKKASFLHTKDADPPLDPGLFSAENVLKVP
jgi:hypothetical protein